MEYSIIEYQGKQFKVAPGDTITVNGIVGKEDQTFTDVKVLLLKDKKTEIGQPYLKETASLKVKSITKSKKIRVATYRAKSRYRKVRGHRQDQTILEFVGLVSIKKAKPKSNPPKKAIASKDKPAKSIKKKS